jgi:signal transduction histidine kinase
LSELQLLKLQKQRDLSENRVRLLTHQLRTAITPIATHVGAARLLQTKNLTQDQAARMIANYLTIAQEMCIRLGRAADTTLNSHVVLLERDDLKLEPYPLSVLVANCAAGFEERANERQRRIVLDDSIELLPAAELDIARFTIAFSNLIDNAIKYSYPGTRIVIRAGDRHHRLDLDHAVIEVQDDGNDIPADQAERIFEAGTRLLTGVKMRQIPGTGLGLWEARAVVEAHGGRITVSSVPASFFYRQQRAHRVTFSIRIPLQQHP